MRFFPPRIATDYPWKDLVEAAFCPSTTMAPQLAEQIAREFRERRLGLHARLAGAALRNPLRLPESLLTESRRILRRNSAEWLQRRAAMLATSELLAKVGIPSAPLKMAALVIHGVTCPERRRAVDIDLLVPDAQISAARTALLAAAYVEDATTPSPHQAQPLRSPNGVCVELHRTIPGVWSRDSAHLTFDAAQHEGLLVQTDWDGRTWSVPTRSLLASHLLVHGIAHHGFGPGTYPPFQMLSDLCDLRESDWRLASPEVGQLCGRTLSEQEIQATDEAVSQLISGDMNDVERGDSPAARLIRHCAASALDPDYASALRLRSVFWRLAEDSPWAALARKTQLDSTSRSNGVHYPRRVLEALAPYCRGLMAEVRLRARRPS